ncbi:SdpI family protein [Lachnospiraceae bacterium MD1]|uniref:SdpI family protein n=1 Tax=Variimorphobacter saccharofermentans TaxID=2755051 RepID=A0A839JYW3_9FIRM|nr:SdpI family protein [Variimorphobacter saccharofermentans]MBB2182172.1 SdpI family protein [Variimorphobacter saccharofermentans]
MTKITNSKFFRLNVVTSLMCLIPLLIGAVFYNQLPDSIPVHFNIYNQPDNYASKSFALFGIPLILLLLQIVCCAVVNSDPKQMNATPQLQYISRFIIPILGIMTQCLIILYVLNDGINVGKVITVVLGIIFLLIGNYLPKCKQNYTIGIRLPWTLADEVNWRKTHRMAGILMVALSILIIIISLAGYEIWTFAILAIAVITPCIYSYTLFKKGKK